MQAVAYYRCSTQMQAESGLGLDAQRVSVEKYAKDKGIKIVASFRDEGASGALGLDDRQGLFDAVRAVPRDGILLVAKRDRLARDPTVVASCEIALSRKKAKIVSASGEASEMDGPYGEFVRGIIDLVSKLERGLIRSRVKDAMAEARMQGRRISRFLPYGMRLGPNGLLERCGSEQRVVQRVLAMRRQKLALSEIGAALLREGLYPRIGTRWYDTQLRRILTRYSKPKKGPNDPTRPERSGAGDRDTEAGHHPGAVEHGAAAGGQAAA